MPAEAKLTYETWRNSRVHSTRVAGIEIQLRVVSTNLLRTLGGEVLDSLSAIDNMSENDRYSRLDFALEMRTVLDTVLPKVLVSPDWLEKALDDFTDNEIIELYNAVMYGAGAQREIDDIPF